MILNGARLGFREQDLVQNTADLHPKVIRVPKVFENSQAPNL